MGGGVSIAVTLPVLCSASAVTVCCHRKSEEIRGHELFKESERFFMVYRVSLNLL